MSPTTLTTNNTPIDSPPTTSTLTDATLVTTTTTTNVFSSLGKGRQIGLLCIFALAGAVDVLNVSSLITATASIARDIGLEAGNIIWVITAYDLSFAGFLLFSGRLSDLYPAQFVFLTGFGGLGILLIVESFVLDKHAFLIIRALQGIFGSLNLPSAYHLIVHLYPDRKSQQQALSALGLSSAIANSLGIVLGGLFELGDSSWKWLFRFLGILSLCATAVGAALMPFGKISDPEVESRYAHAHAHGQGKRGWTKFQRMDMVGAGILTASLCLFILGLTSGTTHGWTSVDFLVPFLLSWGLFAFFFLWEYKQHPERALLPMSLLRLPNLLLWCFTALTPFLWWATVQLGYSNVWQTPEFGYTPILVAARLLPQGIAGFVGGGIISSFPAVLRYSKWLLVGGMAISVAPALILMIFSDGGRGMDYWKYCFPSFVIGSFGMIIAFLTIQVGIIQALPPAASGVGGARFQVCLRIGSSIGLSVQAGLFSRVNNDLGRWEGSRNYLEFDIAWVGMTILVFLIFYKSHAPVAWDLEGEGKEMEMRDTSSEKAQMNKV